MSDQNEKDGPINFYGDSSSSDERDEKQQLRDADEKILSLARQYTNQSTQNIESASLRNVPVGETASIASDGLGRRLSRTVTNMLSHIDTNINPFIEPTDPILDPYSDQFNARAWARHVLRFKDRDPERYPMRTTGVSFRNLGAFGYGTGTDYQKTVANLPLQVPSVIRSFFGHKGDKVQILREFDGLVRSGESCVVLGRPGSGCSTFLKSIAQDTYGFHLTEDTHINYQGITPEQVIKNFRGEVVYNAETEVHFPKLTVGDTLKFAALARTPENRLPGVTRDQHATHARDVVMASFGLLHTMNTVVGDDFIRGVSGGERKRVSIAEVVLAGSSLQCWDNSTRGLDSATALEFIKNLKIDTDISGASIFVSLYQASQDAYDQFEKVTVLYQGRQIFFGRADTAKEFFERMGYECPPRQTTGDFLTSLTSPAERVVKPGYEGRVPATPDEFAQYWKASPEYQALIEEIEEWERENPIGGASVERFLESRSAQQAKHTKVTSPYTLSYWMQVKLCMHRGFLRVKGDPAVALSTVIGNSIMGMIIASVFYNLPWDKTSSFVGRNTVLFFSILFNAMSSALEILTLYAQRPIIEKHKRYAFYRPSAEAFSSVICDLPVKLMTAVAFNIVLYFMTNLRRGSAKVPGTHQGSDPSYFFVFFLFSVLCTLVMSAIFRTIASVTKSISEALTPASLMILMLVTTTGFVIPNVDMHPWFRWIGYINPIAYCFESLMINEYRNRYFTCNNLVPSGDGYDDIPISERSCSIIGAEAGNPIVSGTAYIGKSFEYYTVHMWRNLGIVFGFAAFFYFTYFVCAEVVAGERSRGEVLVFQRGYKRYANDEESQNELRDSNRPPSVEGEFTLQKQEGIFAWRDVCYDIKIKGEPRRLLDNVDGWVQPGTLTALMGSSGAGKTTLLDTLADRLTMGVVTGDMLVNGKQRDKSFQRKTGYVQQQDVHLATSTVREALEFSALLRQPAHISRAEKLAYVDEVIKILEMEEYSDAVVGVPGEGLNVEQRKRLTIGVELAAKPELLLFLDEPTSGLDSQTAWSIMLLMKKLTNSGQAILCTIHQPSAILFQQFDRLLFLRRGGQTVYYGDIGENASKMISYFERNGGPKCSPDANPAEWMLQVIGAAPGSHTDVDWHQTWRNSPEYQKVQDDISSLIESVGPVKSASTAVKENESRSFAASMPTQIFVVCKRVFQQYYRTPSYIYAKAAMCIISPIYVGFTFYKAKNDVQGMQNQMYSIFMFLVVFGTLTQQIMPHFVTQRSLYEVRERPSKTYSWVAFMISNLIVEMPWQTLMSVFSFFCYYYPVGLYRNASVSGATHERGALFFMMVWAFYIYTSTFAHMVVAAIDSADAAAHLSNLLFMITLIFCGIMARPDQFPHFWIFMYRVSPMTYIVSTFMSAGLAGNTVECATKEIVHLTNPFTNKTCGEFLDSYASSSGGAVLNPNDYTGCQFCTMAKTDDFLALLRTPLSEGWRNFGIIIGYIAINCVGALLFYWLGRVPKGSKKKKE
ncbi:uncharacterized protein SAPINGB_P002757 [Magnusiomyces paraingens]|uniref:ABC transporter domain-containing protein n=1 Tax=Magnusiomyces paraingens TaxID=2606893 RepID=A0A5E8BFL0_9ASCO|nr:uncharacterized protein SAPINGB_P002757 [Saprochaete ingens]VVT50426.1 unnamed protein product [Saprochaete ingens]